MEIIATAVKWGMRVDERAIPTHYGEEESHLNPITYGLRVLRVLMRYMNGYYNPA